MIRGTAENRILEWRATVEVCQNSKKKNSKKKMCSSHKYVAFLLCFATWDAEPAEKLLTMR